MIDRDRRRARRGAPVCNCVVFMFPPRGGKNRCVAFGVSFPACNEFADFADTDVIVLPSLSKTKIVRLVMSVVDGDDVAPRTARAVVQKGCEPPGRRYRGER